jgi:hypothetical protein
MRFDPSDVSQVLAMAGFWLSLLLVLAIVVQSGAHP